MIRRFFFASIACAIALSLSACAIPITFKTIETAGFYPDPRHPDPSTIVSDGFFKVNGNEYTLACTIHPMPAWSVAKCVGGGFPFTVPVGKTFCLTHMYLQNKYPTEPPRYGGNFHAAYLQEEGVTASSHHPELHFDPPYPIFEGHSLVATISNGQTEAQNMWAFEQGFMVTAGQACKR